MLEELSLVTCPLSYVTCHMSPVTCHLSPLTCHLSTFTCHLLPVTGQLHHNREKKCANSSLNQPLGGAGGTNIHTETLTVRHTDIALWRLNWPRSQKKLKKKCVSTLNYPVLDGKYAKKKKSRIRETKHLLTNAESSTDTKKLVLPKNVFL